MVSRKIQNALLNRGLQLVRTNNPDDVSQLIQACQPLATDPALIRIGPPADGGYLLPDDFDGINYCFSPGVNDQIGFELDLANRGIRSFMADHSISALPQNHELLEFEPWFIDAIDDAQTRTLETWVNEKAPEGVPGDSILQMDIEISEYATLLAAPESVLRRFRMIAVEFHQLNRLFDPVAFRMMQSCFRKLLTWFDVVHIHPNNTAPFYRVGNVEVPLIMEFTLYQKGYGKRTDAKLVFPHALDIESDPTMPVTPLPHCWQRT